MSEQETALLMRVLRNHQPAVELCGMLARVSQVWDDLYDGDPVSGEQINDAFVTLLLRLPTQPFYVEHFTRLYPVIQHAVYDWMTANEFEKGRDAHELSLGFVLRDSLIAVVTQCAYIVGGHAHAIQVAPEIRRFFHDEAIASYIGEHT